MGTARIARLGFTTIRVETCPPWKDGAAVRARLPQRLALLYPAVGARELATLPAEDRPQHLVILDGTWFQTKKIYAAHAWLRELPAVSLTPREPSRYRIRRAPQARYVATLEAIVYALRIIEPQTRGLAGLLQSFSAMVDRQAAYTATAVSSLSRTSVAAHATGKG